MFRLKGKNVWFKIKAAALVVSAATILPVENLYDLSNFQCIVQAGMNYLQLNTG